MNSDSDVAFGVIHNIVRKEKYKRRKYWQQNYLNNSAPKIQQVSVL